MAEEKQKNEEKRKNDQVEWSFSFDNLSSQISDFVRSLGISGEEAVRNFQIDEPLAGASSARVRLNSPVGETVVWGLAETDKLITADITHVGEVKFAVTGDAEKIVTLSQQTGPADWVRNVAGWFGSQGKLRWDVGLTAQIPLELDIHSGVGKSTFDLRKLNLTGLTLSAGAGELTLTLPETADGLHTTFNGGVGDFDIRVPSHTSVDLNIRAGTGEVDLEIGEGASVTAYIKGGVGEVDVKVAMGAAVRVEATSGIGDIKVPRDYVRLEGSDEWIGKRGIWQSPNFEGAASQIIIKYDGGIGEFKLR